MWKVNSDAQNALSITEKMFRHGRNSFVFKLNEVKVIFEAVQSIKLRSYYDSLCENAGGWRNQCKLLEKIMGLFIGMRSHSYARDVKEKHKAKYNEVTMYSLRTELKKSSKQ